MPPEAPFEDDEGAEPEKGGVPREEWNVGLDQANARIGGLPNMPQEEEDLRKREAESGELDHDNIKHHGDPDDTSVKPNLAVHP